MRLTLLFLTGMSCLFAFSISAQPTLSLYSGTSISSLSIEGDDFGGFTSRIAPMMGIGFNSNLSPKVKLLMDLTYAQRGAGFVLGFGLGKVNFDINYFKFGMLGQVSTPSSGKVSIHGTTGLLVMRQMKCSASIREEEEGVPTTTSTPCEGALDEEDDIALKKTLFGITAGVGLKHQNVWGDITLDALYDIGLTDIAIDEDATAKNRAWIIRLGVGKYLGN